MLEINSNFVHQFKNSLKMEKDKVIMELLVIEKILNESIKELNSYKSPESSAVQQILLITNACICGGGLGELLAAVKGVADEQMEILKKKTSPAQATTIIP